MRKLEKIKQVASLAGKPVKITAEQQTFLMKHNYQGTSNCVILNPTQADEAMMNEISAKMDVRFIPVIEPEDIPEIKLLNLNIKL